MTLLADVLHPAEPVTAVENGQFFNHAESHAPARTTVLPCGSRRGRRATAPRTGPR